MVTSTTNNLYDLYDLYDRGTRFGFGFEIGAVVC